MMGSRSIYHEGWKATTNHISTGVLDEEELAIGSRSFDDDRWELFDLSVDFSEAVDRAGDEPERVRHLSELWTAEAGRNNVLPISDGLVDRLAGFIPPAWPPGPAQTYRPGGGAVADESVPLLWGGFTMTAEIDAGPDDGGVVFAMGDWFGGYAMYLVDGRVHFTFARSADTLELAAPTPLSAGRHAIAVSYALGPDHAPGRMVLLVDDGRGRRDTGGGNAPGRPPARRGGPASRARQRFRRLAAVHASGALQRRGAPAARRDAGCVPTGPGRRGADGPARRLMGQPTRLMGATNGEWG